MVKLHLPRFLRATHPIPFDSDKKIKQIQEHKDFTESQLCPKCNSKNLIIQLLEEGKNGWELVFECEHCQTRGVLSNTGFRVDFIKRLEIKT
jgi:hypothetical protein